MVLHMTSTEAITQELHKAEEARLRKLISELSPSYLQMVGLGTDEAIEAHIAAAVAEA